MIVIRDCSHYAVINIHSARHPLVEVPLAGVGSSIENLRNCFVQNG